MAKKQPSGVCVYCGLSVSKLTRDHVPPKRLFAPKDREQLITVPSCWPCNNGASKDDEYFRNTLVLNESSRASGSRDAARDSLTRSLQRPEARWLATAFFDSLREVEIVTKGGLYVADRTLFRFEEQRITSVVERITRGLFWHETQSALPPRAVIRPRLAWGVPDISPALSQVVADGLSKMAGRVPVKTVVEDAFWYAIMFPEDRSPWRAGFLMEFYRGIGFVVTTDAELPEVG